MSVRYHVLALRPAGSAYPATVEVWLQAKKLFNLSKRSIRSRETYLCMRLASAAELGGKNDVFDVQYVM